MKKMLVLLLAMVLVLSVFTFTSPKKAEAGWILTWIYATKTTPGHWGPLHIGGLEPGMVISWAAFWEVLAVDWLVMYNNLPANSIARRATNVGDMIEYSNNPNYKPTPYPGYMVVYQEK